MKFYKRDPDRALAGMVELNARQRGVYNSIIDLLYSRDGNVPDDDRRVAKMIAIHWREYEAVKSQLVGLGKVWSEDGLLRAKRVQETLIEAASFSQEQSRRRAKGWQDRKKVNENNDPPIPPGSTNTPTPIDRSKRATNVAPKNGTRIPHDWHLTAEGRDFATGLGMSEEEANFEADQFRDYWKAATGAKATKRDWPATWRTWARNASKQKPRRNGHGRPNRIIDMARRLDERAKAEGNVDCGEDDGATFALLQTKHAGWD